MTTDRTVMVHPYGLAGPVAPDDLPDDLRSLYNEARSVAALSTRSAAALLRLTLEGLLKDLYADAGNLNAMIGAARAAGLSEQVVKAMDVLRFNGNESVHEMHADDSPETVATLFDLLGIVVDRLISEPKRIANMYEKMPDTVKEAITRRDTSGNGDV